MAKEQVVQQEQQELEQKEVEEFVGLECLADDVLAGMVKTEIAEHGQLKTQHAAIAFNELARQSGHDIGC